MKKLILLVTIVLFAATVNAQAKKASPKKFKEMTVKQRVTKTTSPEKIKPFLQRRKAEMKKEG